MADADVLEFLNAVPSPRRRRDAHTLLEIMERVTGQPARHEGTGVGFGTYHYKYPSGREGDAAAVGFAPRKAAMVVYLMTGVSAEPGLLKRLGPHTAGVGCLYIKDLSKIDVDVLEQLIARSYAALTADTYRLRAREGGSALLSDQG